jgi:ABC-type Fe3+ transport system permease subunit
MGLFKDCGCGCGGKKQQDKFVISLISALVFFLIASPETYRLTRQVFGSWVSGPTGCASTAGLVLHAVVFLLVTWGLMNLRKEQAGGSCGA